MVLQNKYKARTSRRYNAARGGSSSERGRGRGGPGRSRGGSRMDEASFPELSGEKEEEDGEGDDDGEEQEESEEEGGEQDIQSSERGKYARRKLQSNAWRYEEKEVDPHAEEEEEEPEVDLTALREKVSKLDSSRTTNALSSRKELEDILAKHDEDDADVDRSLSHLLHRQRIRDGKGESSKLMTSRFRLDDAELAELEKEGRRLQEEKEKAQGPRAHMERFKEDRGKATGESTSAKTISLNIGSGRGKERTTDQEEANRRATTRRRTAEVSTLYDDDGHDGDQKILDDLLEASLSKTRIRPPQKQPQGLGNSISPSQDALAKERARTKGQPAVRILQGGAPSASRTEGSAAQSQSNDNQDFLDSVL